MPLDGAMVEQICCTKTGRIFFNAAEVLYELSYYYDAWGRLVYKKQNLTKGFISNLISVFGSKGLNSY
jgi:hypothetical protein